MFLALVPLPEAAFLSSLSPLTSGRWGCSSPGDGRHCPDPANPLLLWQSRLEARGRAPSSCFQSVASVRQPAFSGLSVGACREAAVAWRRASEAQGAQGGVRWSPGLTWGPAALTMASGSASPHWTCPSGTRDPNSVSTCSSQGSLSSP